MVAGRGLRVVSGVVLGAWAALACGGAPPPAPQSSDLVMPAWVDTPERARLRATVLEDKPGTSHAGIHAKPGLDERETRERKKQEAEKSTLLPDSADSKFFGGCGAMKKGNDYECSK